MRKVLSFVLVLSLVLGSFSMAFAATPAGLSDIDGIANEDAVKVNFDLGIVTGNPDGTFLPEKTVTRAEFAAMITRALAIPDSALAGYTATTFKDTAGYGWAVPYLAFCQSKGIMLGDGAGNVMPGRTINTNEAVTMALRAIGYTNNSAELVGAWPANYVTLAQNVELYDDVASTTSVNKANAAQIIYNLLTVEKVAVNSDGDTNGLGTNLLTSGLGCEIEAAMVLTNDNTENSKINVKEYIGAYAVVYTDGGDIVAVGEVKSDFLTGDYDAADGVLDVDGTEYKVASTTAIQSFGYKFANGAETAATPTAITMSAFDADNIKVAVDVTGKTIDKVYSVSAWTVDEAEQAASTVQEDIADDELLGSDFTLDDDDNIDLNSFELVGVTSLSKIAEDNVVYVYEDNSNGDIVKVAVGTEVVKGKVTDVDGTEFVVNGKTYETASDAGIAAADQLSAPDAGDTITAYLDAFGNVFTWEKDSGSADTFGIIKAHAAAGINDEQVKLYTSADATTTFNIDDDADWTSNAGITIGGVGNLMGYALNSAGDIDTVDLTVVTAAAAQLSSAKVLVAGATSPIADDCVVFTIDSTGGYGVSSIDKVETATTLLGGSYTAFQYIEDGDGYVVAMIVYKDAAGKSATDTYGVFDKTTTSINADDDTVQRLVGLANGADFDKIATKATVVTLTKTAIQLYKIDLDADGFVTKTSLCAVDTTVNGAVTIAALNSDKTAVQVGTTWYALGAEVVVYQAEKNDDGNYEYTKSSASSLRASYKISLFELDSDEDGYEVVIFEK